MPRSSAPIRAPDAGEVGPSYRGPQPGAVCKDGDKIAPSRCATTARSARARADSCATRQLGSREPRRPCGSRSPAPTAAWPPREGAHRGAQGPRRAARGQDAERDRARRALQVDLPGDRKLQEALDWGKQNLADLTQTATNLQIRFVDQGKAYPAPVHNVTRATFIGAGYPDYPWLFATDGEYTAFAAVALGQFERDQEAPARAARRLRRVNANSGKVAHEVVTDGSVYFGANTDPGNTDETAKFPCAVALVWRWTGDDRFRDELYDFSRRRCSYVTGKLDADKDGWPEGLGNVERAGMGEEKLDNAVYLIRGLYDFADMARAKKRTADAKLGQGRRRSCARASRRRGGTRSPPSTPTRSRPASAVQQQHWIGVTPMEAELTTSGAPRPAWRRPSTPAPRSTSARRTASAAPTRSTSGCSTPAARAAPTARASRSSSRSRARSPPSARATTAARAAAPVHGRQRAGDARARREARRAAGDPPVARPGREHRPLLDLPLDVHAGLGQTARVARDPPAARRPAVDRHRQARSCPAIPDGQSRVGGKAIRPAERHGRRRGAPRATAASTPTVVRLRGV